MQTNGELCCCKMHPCITTSYVFHDTYLNRNVLTVCVINFFGDDVECLLQLISTYRQYILYIYGYLGRGNCKVASARVVLKIRDNYPSQDNNYLGFREH